MTAETVVAVLRAAEGYLRERGVEAPRLSIEWMLGRVLGLSRLQVYMAHDRPLGVAEKQTLRAMVKRRGTGEPLAYVLGDQEFCGFEFRVDRHVLIPRPETEGLVDLVRSVVPEGARGADIGTGCGAIAVALCKLRPDLQMLATDVCPAALTIAAGNAEALGVADRVEFRVGHYWEPLAAQSPLDFVVSNPPYVDPNRPDLLADDVAKFEPARALYTPAGDPAAAYRELVAGLPGRLRPGAWVWFETGVGADQAALSVMAAASYLSAVELRCDDAGLPRYLLGRFTPD